MKTLKQIRKERGFSQEQFASLIGMPRRTYQRYEDKSENEIESEKLRETLYKVLGMQFVDETHGILSLHEIGQKVRLVCEKYPEVECVYLFGSYAKGTMTEQSDVDLFYVANGLKGLQVAGFYGELTDILHKEVDLLSSRNIEKNPLMIDEIFKFGIKLYGKK